MVLPSWLISLQIAPQHPAQLHIHAGGGLVQDDQLGIVDQGARQHHAALQAAGQFAERFLLVRRSVRTAPSGNRCATCAAPRLMPK